MLLVMERSATAAKYSRQISVIFIPETVRFRNNRFLQYGFYNFGHLLIGKNSSGHYILGVPGGYDQQERFMANMFGFPYFKESRQIQLPKSRGGYWYRLINPRSSTKGMVCIRIWRKCSRSL